jgi:hypothetical protein
MRTKNTTSEEQARTDFNTVFSLKNKKLSYKDYLQETTALSFEEWKKQGGC